MQTISTEGKKHGEQDALQDRAKERANIPKTMVTKPDGNDSKTLDPDDDCDGFEVTEEKFELPYHRDVGPMNVEALPVGMAARKEQAISAEKTATLRGEKLLTQRNL